MSRLDPLALSGDERGRCKALFFAVLDRTSTSDPETVNFFWRPRELGLRTHPFRVDCKRYHLRSYQLPRSCDDSSFFAVTQQQWRV